MYRPSHPFAKSAYLDNPIPSLFKERLFVFLSRFCQVRYCIVRHCGFLVGYGHSSGDASAPPQSIAQVIRLLKALPPWRRELEPIYERLAAFKTPTDWPDSDSELEDCIFAAAAVIFVEPGKSERARDALRQALGGKRFEYLIALLAFIRAAHFWTVAHPGLDDRGRHENTHERRKGTRRVAPARPRFARTIIAWVMSAFDPKRTSQSLPEYLSKPLRCLSLA